MKILSLRLIVALIIGVTLVSLASSWYELRATKDALRLDLKSKAEILGQSLAAGAEVPLQAGDTARLELIVRRSPSLLPSLFDLRRCNQGATDGRRMIAARGARLGARRCGKLH